jgi:hypothetical protein
LQGLQDNVGDVDTGHQVAVRLGSHQLAPTQGTAAADLVVDDDFLPKTLFKYRLLAAGFAVGLPARVEGDQVGDGLGWIGLILGRG